MGIKFRFNAYSITKLLSLSSFFVVRCSGLEGDFGFDCIFLTLLTESPQPPPRSDLLEVIFKLFFIVVLLN